MPDPEKKKTLKEEFSDLFADKSDDYIEAVEVRLTADEIRERRKKAKDEADAAAKAAADEAAKKDKKFKLK